MGVVEWGLARHIVTETDIILAQQLADLVFKKGDGCRQLLIFAFHGVVKWQLRGRRLQNEVMKGDSLSRSFEDPCQTTAVDASSIEPLVCSGATRFDAALQRVDLAFERRSAVQVDCGPWERRVPGELEAPPVALAKTLQQSAETVMLDAVRCLVERCQSSTVNTDPEVQDQKMIASGNEGRTPT